MTLPDLIALVQGQHWLGLIALFTLLARKWASPESKFPISIPVTWQPTVTAAGGLVYGLISSLQRHQPVGDALLAMALAAGSGGFLDGVLMAVFNHDNAPVWARSIVFVFDDLTGKGGGPAPKPNTAAAVRIAKSIHPPPPTNVTRGRVGFGFAAVWLALITGTAINLACSKPIVAPPNAPADVENAIGCVTTALISSAGLEACIAQYGPALVADALQILIHSTFGKEHPELLPKMQAKLAAMKVAP